MKIALILTVKNEERLLRKNLLYHHTIGVEKIYVYFDNATDKGKESIKDLKFVEILNSVAAKEFQHHLYLEKFTSLAQDHHTARQCLNTFAASVKAENEGYDWLISLDADELIVTGEKEISNLKSFFLNIPHHIDAVNFLVREVLQARKYYDNVFAEETRFKTQRGFKKYSPNIFKKLYNPATGRYEKYVYWYGHQAGKMAIRLGKGLIPFNVHRFRNRQGEKPETAVSGLLLHYHSFDATDFIKKYQNFISRPDTYLSGRKVGKLKMLLITVVNKCGMTRVDLENYFEQNLMFKDNEIEKMWRNRIYLIFKRKTPVLTEITAVKNVFQKLQK